MQNQAAQNADRHAKMKPKMKEATTRLYEGCVEAGECVAQMDPELIILHSPHGTLLSNSVALYGNQRASGTAEWEGHWSEFEVNVPLCTETTERLRNQLNDHKISTEIVRTFSGVRPFPLCWGEAVPIWFVKKAMGDKDVKYVIMTSPRSKQVSTIEESLLSQASALAEFIKSDPRRIVLVISGDLSHMYSYDCTEEYYTPNVNSNFPSPRDDEAREMEAALKSWVLSSKIDCKLESSSVKKRRITPETDEWDSDNAIGFLQEACNSNPRTLSCGMQGFIVLHSLMSVTSKEKPLSAFIHTCEAPTYYGMMAASFTPIK